MDKEFKFKKQFGQNFIFDKNFLNSIVRELNIDKNSNILEIGAGMGTLTTCLAENYKKIVSFEIDKTLKEYLLDLQSKYCNVSFIFQDILSVETHKIEQLFGGENYNIVANLPYYITSAIIFKFLFESKKLEKIYVMVQKEVAERYCAKNSTKDYGIPSVLLDSFGYCKIIKNVNRKMFKPIPKVDSCIIEIKIDLNKYKIDNINKYKDFVSNCFKMKRKTLYNNLISYGLEKNKIKEAFVMLNVKEDCRAESISTENFVKLFNLFF